MRLISIVIPLYNEEDNISSLYQELVSVADRIRDNVEFVFVDDGSRDKTADTLAIVAAEDDRVRLVRFRRNFGQTAAIAAGFDHANGDIIVILDGDLQNDPAEIPRMIYKLDEGYDLVAGWRKHRRDAFVSRKLPSMIANRLISSITGVVLHDYGCTLKVMKAEVAHSIKLYGEMHRFIPALAAEMGVKIAELPVNHRPRIHGTSKYGISRTFRVILDLLTVKFFLGYSTRPLHMFGLWGLGSAGFGSLLLAFLAVEKLFLGVPMGNRPLLMLGVMLVIVGLQFVCFGLLAEILVRTYHESQNKLTYTVREVNCFGAKKSLDQRKVVDLV